MNTKLNAKRILIYGDSITWGRIAKEQARFDTKTRYTAVLQNELGDDYEVIEEGLRTRMAKGDNPYLENRDGYKQFPPIFSSHLPIDVLVIFLGTNDTNLKANKSPEQITEDLESYLELVNNSCETMGISKPQHIVFIGTPSIDEVVLKDSSMFDGASAKAEKLSRLIESMAEKNGCKFFDASNVVEPSKEDGVHLDAENNIKLGKEIAKFIKELL